MKTTFLNILFTFFFLPYNQLFGQVNNDECFTAVVIDDLENFCSDIFSNAGASTSSNISPDCWGEQDEESDVWFSFVPRKPGLLLRFFGSGDNTIETLDNVALGIYEGRCSALTLISCERRAEGVNDIFEKLYTDLIIGRVHYIRVSSRNSDAGTFQICLSDFIPVPDPKQDCSDAVILCGKNSFVVERIEGVGLQADEAEGSCLDGITPNSLPNQPVDPSETGSVWYKWTAKNNGTLTFTLFPNNEDPEEDLDFAIYRLPLGLEDCSNKELLMCMASGSNGIGSPVSDAPCKGPTGLMEGDGDVVEFAGCQPGDNNFLAPLDMVEGESYALIVNNFSESGFGFTIEFGGTGEFRGPETDFTFKATDDFKCDQTILFEDNSSSQTDPIVNYQWRFGEGAQPEFATGSGPHEVIYESFGPKIAVLTVESSRGCRVTEVEDLNIDPCCDEMSPLELDLQVTDVTCFESNDGIITANVLNGSPEYLYAFDGGVFQPNEIFQGIAAGGYTVDVVDIKGCESSQSVVVNQPVEIMLFLRVPQDTIALGLGGQLFSDFSPLDRRLIYTWTPPDGLLCSDCPNPEVIPPGTTTYTLTVEDQDGCIQSEQITVFTTDFKPFIAPNIISLNPSNPDNGIFKVSSNEAVDMVESIWIFDRWGNELYKEQNFHPGGDIYVGWDGISSPTNQKVNPGVYIWMAKVRFIDGDVRTFAGDVTVVD